MGVTNPNPTDSDRGLVHGPVEGTPLIRFLAGAGGRSEFMTLESAQGPKGYTDLERSRHIGLGRSLSVKDSPSTGCLMQQFPESWTISLRVREVMNRVVVVLLSTKDQELT